MILDRVARVADYMSKIILISRALLLYLGLREMFICHVSTGNNDLDRIASGKESRTALND